ncbi:MAG: OB-fold nucleic acid binding domain-containing protein [Candidatus Micrarchaeota archaeon]|nr:OB-fold nucleic acid binding domain-containing protein [Candidatus Micrarchaeota archaeon]
MDRIADLRPGMNASIEAEVVSIEPSREVRTKFGKLIRVANATVADDSGQIIVTLWDKDIDRVSIGDKIKIENGWVSDFKGNLQITAGKNGKLEIIQK